MLCAVMRRVLTSAVALTAAVAVTACGDSSGLPANESAAVKRGAELFTQRCNGCHTLGTVSGEGSTSDLTDRERVDGPNFDVRKVTDENVLYALRNGGYSGAIMPENIVVGKDAADVAAFLAKYSGVEAQKNRTDDENKARDSAR